MATRVAIVTGSNKGIGLAMVRGLCKQFDGHVYLTARDESRGQKAIEDLEKEGLKPQFYQLDINDQSSIDKMADYIKTKYGGLDVLVNNAGIAFPMSSTAPFSEQAETTIKVNYNANLAVYDAFLPLLRPQARVVYMSSMAASMAYKKCSPAVQDQMKACKVIGDVSKLMDKFVSDAKAGRHKDEGWAESGYGTSKLAVYLMTVVQQAALDAAKIDAVVNCCCPGPTGTDMTNYTSKRTTDEGADTPLYLALLPEGTNVRGKFVYERNVQNWMV